MQQKRKPRFAPKPEHFERRQTTDRSFLALLVIVLYRFIPTSFIASLVPGDRRTTLDHLQMLFHKGLINRFQMSRKGEFIYFVDNNRTVQLVVDEGYRTTEDVDFDAIKTNRERRYAQSDDPGKRLFVKHELMISRFHFMLESACRQSNGQMALQSWKQGAVLRHTISIPELSFNAKRNVWYR